MPRGPQPTGYRDPLRGVAHLVPERIDMGVDYAGSGPLYAFGPGVITSAGHAWAGAVGAPVPGTWITERITSGPLAGSEIYTAEDIFNINVHPGEHVTADTRLGDIRGGIETGFAAPGPAGTQGETLAAQLGQQAQGGDPGAWASAAGVAYSDVLRWAGAPAGVGSGPGHGTNPSWLQRDITSLTGSTPGGGGAGGGGSGGGAVLTSSGPGGLASILSGTGSLFHGAAEALDWLFGFWYPGQGWRIVFGAAAVASGYGAVRSWQSSAQGEQPGGSLPLSIGLAGVAALAAFMALRPWPQVGTQPVKPGAYIVETLEGQPPVAGQPRPKDVTGIEIGLGVLAGAWLASKLASAGSGVLGFLSGLGAALFGKGGAPEVPPVEPPLPVVE